MADGYFIDVAWCHHWVIDWSKVTTFEHLKELLQCCDMQPKLSHPQFDEIKHLCKLIDSDGKQVDPKTLQPIR